MDSVFIKKTHRNTKMVAKLELLIQNSPGVDIHVNKKDFKMIIEQIYPPLTVDERQEAFKTGIKYKGSLIMCL